MVSTRSVAKKVQTKLDNLEYVTAVFLQEKTMFAKKNSLVIVERDSDKEYVMPLKEYCNTNNAVNDIVRQFLTAKDDEFKSSIDREYVIAHVYPVLVAEKPTDLFFGTWEKGYVIYQYEESGCIKQITTKHLKAMDIGPRDLTEYAKYNLLKSIEITNVSELKDGKHINSLIGTSLRYFDIKSDNICFLHSKYGNTTGIFTLRDVFSVIADNKNSDLLVIAVNDDLVLAANMYILDEIYSNSKIKDLHQLGYCYLKTISKFANTRSPLAAPYRFSRKTSLLELL